MSAIALAGVTVTDETGGACDAGEGPPEQPPTAMTIFQNARSLELIDVSCEAGVHGLRTRQTILESGHDGSPYPVRAYFTTPLRYKWSSQRLSVRDFAVPPPPPQTGSNRSPQNPDGAPLVMNTTSV